MERGDRIGIERGDRIGIERGDKDIEQFSR